MVLEHEPVEVLLSLNSWGLFGALMQPGAICHEIFMSVQAAMLVPPTDNPRLIHVHSGMTVAQARSFTHTCVSYRHSVTHLQNGIGSLLS